MGWEKHGCGQADIVGILVFLLMSPVALASYLSPLSPSFFFCQVSYSIFLIDGIRYIPSVAGPGSKSARTFTSMDKAVGKVPKSSSLHQSFMRQKGLKGHLVNFLHSVSTQGSL